MHKYRVFFKSMAGDEIREEMTTVQASSENHACLVAGATLAGAGMTEKEFSSVLSVVAELV